MIEYKVYDSRYERDKNDPEIIKPLEEWLNKVSAQGYKLTHLSNMITSGSKYSGVFTMAVAVRQTADLPENETEDLIYE